RHPAAGVPDLLRLAAGLRAHHRAAGRDQPHHERREPRRLGHLSLSNTPSGHRRGTPARMRAILKRAALVLAACALTGLAIRAWDSRRGPPLELWHTFVPDELRAKAIDAIGWDEYLAAEERVFTSVRTQVTDRLDAGDRV